MNLDWLIIGGGIHGVHIAARLLGDAGIRPDGIRIVDPGERLLSRWRSCSEVTGMTHLRSSSVQHLDICPRSLRHFAVDRVKRKPELFAYPNDRPALSLFNAHCDYVLEQYELAELHIRDTATGCSLSCDSVNVQLLNGSEIQTQNLVLAIGDGDKPLWPDWAPQGDMRVQHIFDPDFTGWPTSDEAVVVIGGGISAGQVALRLVDEGHRVHLVSRHALRQHEYDSDPGWLGPKNMIKFSRERDFNRRRSIISEARYRGSVPPYVKHSLRRAIAQKKLHWHEDEVEALIVQGDVLKLSLSDNTTLEADRALLATGFCSLRPGGELVDSLIASASLECANCGYPIVDTELCWHPRIYVTGPLAELELGPVARNIAGARRAGDRLVRAARRALLQRQIG